MSAARLPDTGSIFRCPQYHIAVRADDTVRRSCALNLALAAVLAEGCTCARLPHFEPGTPRPIAELPRFGEFLASQRYIPVINPTIVDLPDLVERLWQYFQPKVDAAGVALAREVPAGLHLAQADAERIYWVLYQLLDNATEFTPAGRRVAVAAVASAETMRLSVRDTSLSLSNEQLRLIFEPFAQAADGPGPPADGTGLGLALVKRVVEARGSRVEVETRGVRNSPSSFELPLARLASE